MPIVSFYELLLQKRFLEYQIGEIGFHTLREEYWRKSSAEMAFAGTSW